MSSYTEIAFAAVSNRLCLFTGTGFSKAVTSETAHTWQGLLESVCNIHPELNQLKDTLFPTHEQNPLSLDEAAQVIEIELLKHNKFIHQEIAKIIKTINLSGNNNEICDFFTKESFRVITTNYDKLIEALTAPNECQSFAPGLPIPRSSSKVKVYHVHGSIDSPSNMVVTADDYFKFLNTESYFSKKLSTILYENTVVFLGYSLGDTNLKTIISDYANFSKNNFIGSNIFFVSRKPVATYLKDYYSRCYGIRVIDNTSIHNFFLELNKKTSTAKTTVTNSIQNLNNALAGNYNYPDDYLKIEDSFYEIVASIAAIGNTINQKNVVTLVESIIKRKTEFTATIHAWEQYEHLARWLIYIASILEIKNTSIETTFLESVKTSMKTMGNRKTGYSWHAYNSWNNRWDSITPSNRLLINDYILRNNPSSDATSIVSRK